MGAVFACDDDTLRFTTRQSLSEMQTSALKLCTKGEYIVSLSFSPMGCVCVAITNKYSMFVFGDKNLSTEQMLTLLEYSLYSGTEWDDVLMCLRPG